MALWGFSRQSPEVKAALAELRLIESNLKKSPGPFLGDASYAFMKDDVRKAVTDNPAEVTRRIRDGTPPRALIYTLILNVLGREISSGRNHIYRGVLSMQGKSMLTLFDWVVRQEESEGLRDAEDVTHAREMIREQIKEAG
jgi:hypothetical protein